MVRLYLLLLDISDNTGPSMLHDVRTLTTTTATMNKFEGGGEVAVAFIYSHCE